MTNLIITQILIVSGTKLYKYYTVSHSHAVAEILALQKIPYKMKAIIKFNRKYLANETLFTSTRAVQT